MQLLQTFGIHIGILAGLAATVALSWLTACHLTRAIYDEHFDALAPAWTAHEAE